MADPNGERYAAVYIISARGKRMVTGRATKERLGLIQRGSVIQNVHEADIAADAGKWACPVCGNPFTVQGEKAWCNNCTPRAGARRDLSQLRPRPASERIKAQTQHGQQPHPNFAGMQQDPWGEQKDVSARQQPDHAQPSQPLPPPPGAVGQVQQVPPPPVPGQRKSTIPEIQQARAQKEQSMGIPVVENKVPPPPAPLASPDTSRGVKSAKIDTVVDNRYARLLRKNGVDTLYDASKKGVFGLEGITGIGHKTAVKIVDAAEMELARGNS